MIAYDLIGQTPLVLLESFSDENVKIYAKLEQFNPGGSIKDRLGKYLIEKAIDEGRLKEGDTIVEATAGNTGIGLAIASNRHKVKCIIFAPEGFAEEKISIMKALGADVRRTPKAEGMTGAQQEALAYATRYGYLYMNQFNSKLKIILGHIHKHLPNNSQMNFHILIILWQVLGPVVRLQELHNT